MTEVEMTMTAGNARVVRTMCPMNCHPTFCGMLVEVEHGKLKTVSGDKDNPDRQGFLCVRGRSTNEIFGNPRRLYRRDPRGSAGNDMLGDCNGIGVVLLIREADDGQWAIVDDTPDPPMQTMESPRQVPWP
jgi:hypothetical protein